MKSYFFIPASRLRKLSDIKKLAVNAIIIDFEDAILSSEVETYFKELITIDNITSYWFRIPVRADFKDDLNLEYIEKFKTVLPVMLFVYQYILILETKAILQIKTIIMNL